MLSRSFSDCELLKLAKIIPLIIALFKVPVIIVLFCTGVRVRLSNCLFLKTQNRLELPHDVSISGIVEEHVVQLLDWLYLGDCAFQISHILTTD